MDPIYAETINSFANDLDSLWKDKNAFSSVKSSEGVSIEDGNLCSYKRFMLSTTRALGEETNLSGRTGRRAWGPVANQSMPITERLAKTVSIWTLPNITRAEADNILNDFEPGIFLVRMNTDKKTMVLSYRMTDRSQHVLIKVDPKKGFFMDGSQHVFRNVNHMIAHYMKNPVQNPDLCLKLPRALMEAHEVVHFKFFENMKKNFWTTLLANKSIDDIWSKPAVDSRTKERNEESQPDICPPVPPRGYHLNELHILQGLADVSESVDDYGTIQKKSVNKPKPPPKSSPVVSRANETEKKDERVYSQIWQWKTDGNPENIMVEKSQIPPQIPFDKHPLPRKNSIECDKTPRDSLKDTGSQDFDICFTIPKIIEKYYPQIIYNSSRGTDKFSSCTSLKDELLQRNQELPDERVKYNKIEEKKNSVTDPIYQGQYETPWDIKNSWLSKLIDIDNRDLDSQSNMGSEFVPECPRDISIGHGHFDSLPPLPTSLQDQKSPWKNSADSLNRKESSDGNDTDEEEDDLTEEESRLQLEFLGEIESKNQNAISSPEFCETHVMFSPSANSQIYSPHKSQYGQSIRNFLTRLCSRRGSSDIAQKVRLFISCTVDRNDLSPYTTMRLIRQFMSGLKNLITKNKDEFSLNVIINEEIKNTPKNVFINLDSIIESVLTKSVLKPLKVHVYRLLVLEHYKNNNLRLIADGIEASKVISLEKLGLKESIKAIIDTKLDSIRSKFTLISKQYSPERKIKYMISIVDIVFNMVNLIYPETDSDPMHSDIKLNSILPLFVYIFSQCKLDAVATQCEVEYVEGLIWSSRLVNGEPGFFLLNLMSALEAIKVLARPRFNTNDVIDLADNNPIKINNSSFFSKISPSSLSSASVGSVNVIILDEKINRLVAKTFPVRSTVTVVSLCNTIAHRLGIFNPKEYSLYKYNGFDECLLNDHDCPLMIKQTHQQSTGENVNFLFKRKHANFILPCDISAR